MQEERNCPHYGTSFAVTSKYPERKYCSKECGYAAKTARGHTERTCLTCGKTFMAKNVEIKRRGGKYCSRECWRTNPPRTKPGPEQMAKLRNRKGAANPCYRGEAVTVGAAHDRIRAAKGHAREHSCVHCGRPARDWALRHDAEEIRLDAAKQRNFSLSVDDYMPMCRRCHWHYDHPDGAPERYFGANAWRAA